MNYVTKFTYNSAEFFKVKCASCTRFVSIPTIHCSEENKSQYYGPE